MQGMPLSFTRMKEASTICCLLVSMRMVAITCTWVQYKEESELLVVKVNYYRKSPKINILYFNLNMARSYFII